MWRRSAPGWTGPGIRQTRAEPSGSLRSSPIPFASILSKCRLGSDENLQRAVQKQAVSAAVEQNEGVQVRGSSRLHDDFVVLTDAHAVSPTLKIAVRLGRWDMEMNGVQEVKVEYDPLIDSARLMMPETESPYHVPSQYDPPKPRLIPFFSRDRVELIGFGFVSRAEGDSIVFFCAYDDHTVSVVTEALTRQQIPGVKENTAAFLHLVLQTIGRLRDWPLVVPGLSAPKRVEVRIASNFVEALEQKSGLTLPMAVPGECLVARWELDR